MPTASSARPLADASPPAAALDLSSLVHAGDTVVWGQACAEPLSLTRRLAEQQPAIGALTVFLGATLDQGARLAWQDGVSAVSYGGASANRRLDAAGRLEVLPCHYSDLPRLMASGQLPIDVALVQVSPGVEPGTYHFALAAEYLVAAARAARVVIAEVNNGAPHTPDAPILRAEDITAIVFADYPPAAFHAPPSGAVDLRIAEHVSRLVEDGSTIQVGLGALPETILRSLADRRDLGVHSGTIGDAVAELMEAGVITNARKTHDRGVTVAGMLMGSERLLGAAAGNAKIALRETGYTHDPGILAAQPRFVAINSAVEIDVTGQVNSEVAAGRYVGAVGGALDFLRGAHRSHGGLPIIALPSTAGAHSRIVARLSGPTTVPRSEVGIVVTEYGVADLRGLTASQRRARLLELAHPEHRAALADVPPAPGERRHLPKESP